MESSEGEEIKLTGIISVTSARGQVEKWLLELESYMLSSIKKVSKVLGCEFYIGIALYYIMQLNINNISIIKILYF